MENNYIFKHYPSSVKLNGFFVKLQVFSSTEFRLSPVPIPYTVEKQVSILPNWVDSCLCI